MLSAHLYRIDSRIPNRALATLRRALSFSSVMLGLFHRGIRTARNMARRVADTLASSALQSVGRQRERPSAVTSMYAR